LLCAARARRRVLGEQARDDVVELGLHATVERGEPWGILAQVKQEQLVGVLGLVEGTDPGDALVEHEPDGVEIRASVDALALGLLGRHVAWRTDGDAPSRDDLGARVCELRDAEVEELHRPAAGHEDVRGLHVAMHDADLVSGGERVEHRRRDVNRPRDADGLLAVEQRGERLALHPLHHVVRLVVVRGPGVGDVDDVRVIEPPEGAPLLAQARDEVLAGGQVSEQGLEDELLAELGVLDQIDRAHAPGAEVPDDPVAGTGNDLAVGELASHGSRRAATRGVGVRRHRG